MRKLYFFWSLTALFLNGVAHADDLSDTLKGIETHAFVSQGGIKTTSNNYLADSALGSFSFTEVGINFTKQLNEDLRMGLQLFGHQLGSDGNFNANVDWFYLDYHPSDRLGFRFGRIKIPFGLYNEINDIDAARVPILLPQSVYPIVNSDYLLAQNGFEVYGYTGTGPAGGLEYRVYGGTISVDENNTGAYPIQITAVNVPYVAGGRLMWQTPLEGLRAGSTFQALRIDTTIKVGTLPISFEFPVWMWIASTEYIKGGWSLAAEYSRWYGTFGDSTNTAILPNFSVINERGYLMGAYRVNKWFEPGLYYSAYYPNVNMRDGRANYEHDLSATLRFDINRYWLVKLEGHYMVGTAYLAPSLNSPGLNNGVPLSGLTPTWGAFLLKTTGYF